ncbi:MAG TPA: hypothetical protein VFX69_16445 [Steroidobacteraceae bacterium]|jgi:hypothetical protein|nr:hypothetical protein [Steroidobacteraceae bacterium]
MSVPQTTATSTTVARRWARVILAGPLVLLCSLGIMGGANLWVPPGAGGVNDIVLPILLYPAVWTALFFYACFERRIGRGYAIVGGLTALHAIVFALRTSGWSA